MISIIFIQWHCHYLKNFEVKEYIFSIIILKSTLFFAQIFSKTVHVMIGLYVSRMAYAYVKQAKFLRYKI